MLASWIKHKMASNKPEPEKAIVSDSLFDYGYDYIDVTGVITTSWLKEVIQSMRHALHDGQYTFMDKRLMTQFESFVAKALAFTQTKGYPVANNDDKEAIFSAIFNDGNIADGLNKLTKSRFEVLHHARVDYMSEITGKKALDIPPVLKERVSLLLYVAVLFENITIATKDHTLWQKESIKTVNISIFYQMMPKIIVRDCLNKAPEIFFMLINHLLGDTTAFQGVVSDIDQKIENVIIKKHPDLVHTGKTATDKELSEEKTDSKTLVQKTGEALQDGQLESKTSFADLSYFNKEALTKYILKNITDCNIKEAMFYDPEECVNAIYLTDNCFYQFAVAHKKTIQSIDALITYLRQEKITSRDHYKITLPDGTENEVYCLSLNDIPDVMNDCPGEIWQVEDESEDNAVEEN